MKLTFHGASYDYEPFTINTIESEITGHFLRATYKIRRPIIARPPSVRNLKYRGVTY
ncbi:MAG: DUF4278 domain-containing protein [Xenococcaceae cyanobacterium]